jgi:hypothetical protein
LQNCQYVSLTRENIEGGPRAIKHRILPDPVECDIHFDGLSAMVRSDVQREFAQMAAEDYSPQVGIA